MGGPGHGGHQAGGCFSPPLSCLPITEQISSGLNSHTQSHYQHWNNTGSHLPKSLAGLAQGTRRDLRTVPTPPRQVDKARVSPTGGPAHLLFLSNPTLTDNVPHTSPGLPCGYWWQRQIRVAATLCLRPCKSPNTHLNAHAHTHTCPHTMHRHTHAHTQVPMCT